MPYVLDESSYRIEKNVFPTPEEARERAEEAARMLGRPVTVYELVAQELHFAFRVMPDGTVDETNPLPEHVPVEPSSPAVLGGVAVAGTEEKERFQALKRIVRLLKKQDPLVDDTSVLDGVAEALEQAGRADLAAVIDRENAG